MRIMSLISISNQTARRFVLGRQGLWPGRRWRGKAGMIEAMRAGEALQLDPLNIGARSQDIILHSRVLDYNPKYLSQAAYEDRLFFDYGGWLAMYPMQELPYWRRHMEKRARDEYVKYFVPEHQAVLEHVRAELRKRGPLGNRDFDGKRLKLQSYRGRKETSVALFDMWLSGELMIHHRAGFDRVYDFRENVAPTQFDYVASEAETVDFFARKAVAFMGLKNEAHIRADMRASLNEDYSIAQMKEMLGRWKESGMLEQVRVEGRKETYLILAGDVPALETIAKGKVPADWKPKGTTTLEEITLLSPLDVVSARGRARKLFDFEYKWEVYTPLAQRRWGYYVLPILYGDDLVARLDPKLDRQTRTLHIPGFWLEDDAPTDEAFANALGRGIAHFATLVGAKKVQADGIRPKRLAAQAGRVWKPILDSG
jgi:uncharacterized protein YcaQ